METKSTDMRINRLFIQNLIQGGFQSFALGRDSKTGGEWKRFIIKEREDFRNTD